MTLSPTEAKQRRDQIEYARATNQAEGAILDPEICAIEDRYIAGEIDRDQMISLSIEIAQRKAKEL